MGDLIGCLTVAFFGCFTKSVLARGPPNWRTVMYYVGRMSKSQSGTGTNEACGTGNEWHCNERRKVSANNGGKLSFAISVPFECV
jgi:hypothetical protein